jgi:protein TonB
MEKDINSVLYSFQPAPGPADLAIFMHRLVEASAAASDAQIDAAFAQVAAAPAPEEKRKGKGLVISKKEKAAEPAPVPEPVEVSQPAMSLGDEPGKSRTGLFAGIGVGLVVLAAAAYFMTRGKAPEPAPVPTPVPAAVTEAAPATTVAEPAAPEKVIDPKALEAELRKATAEEAKKLRDAAQKAAAEQAKPAPAGVAQPAAPAVSLAPSQPLQPPRAAPEPTRAPEPPKAAEPTPVPPRPTEPPAVVEVPRPAAPPPAAPAAASAAVREGDLVGPGAGVVEPQIVKLGRFPALPPQAKQIQARRNDPSGLGTVAIMALVTESGQVSEARVVRSSSYKFVDEAALAALRGSEIKPATKGGVRVKMWKTFSITVKP